MAPDGPHPAWLDAPPGAPRPQAKPPGPPPVPRRRRPPRGPGWTTGRIVSVVTGAVLALCALGALGVGGAALWAETAQRSAGYVDLGTAGYATGGRALASGTIGVHGWWGWLRPLIGQIRIRVTGTGRPGGVFAGVAPARAARSYLSGVSYTTVTGYGGQRISHAGGRIPEPPGSMPIWAARSTGARTATLRWGMPDGDWTVIIMNSGASAGVRVRADVAASLPALSWLAGEFLGGGVVLALGAFACIVIPVRMAAAGGAAGPGEAAVTA
jgi:hypothetical protein